MLADSTTEPDRHPPMSDNKSQTFYPAGPMKLHTHPIVLIHGWGVNSDIWESLPEKLSEYADVITLDLPGFGNSPPIDQYSEWSLNDWLYHQLPQSCYLIGLSLGGMLCRSFAAQYPDRILGLITLSTNLKFIADSQYSTAMPRADFDQFSAIWDQDPATCINRFLGLQAQSDQYQRQLTRQLRTMNSNIDILAGRDLLKLLVDIDGRAHIEQISCPALSIFGEKDSLVPVAASMQLPELHDTLIIKSAAHLPHLSAQTHVLDRIYRFLNQSKYQLDKSMIAQSFGRAAKTYDSAADIQKWSGNQLLDSLKTNGNPAFISDLGCGTGKQVALLKKMFPQAQVTGIDFSAPMLDFAKTHHADKSIKWLCCDAENLTLSDQSEDLIFSNFALQWCNDLSPSLSEVYRVLKPQGEFHFAIPGPRTLWELRQVWSQIDQDIHINRFLSLSQWQAALDAVGFKRINLKSTTKIAHHASVKDLLWNLKTVGATNHNSGKNKRLTGKTHLKMLYEAYNQFKTSQGTVPATWDIIFGSAVK
jgi:malonyl-CoA O-methyltransferase